MMRLTLIASIVFIAALALVMPRVPQPSFAPPALDRFPVQGIDVSHHQREIDWPTVAGDPRVRFVYMKATEGGDHRDTRFAENWRAAREAGLAVGAYHYFTFCRPGVEQAQNVIATVPRDAGALPLAVDLEFHGNCRRDVEADWLATELRAFLAATTAYYGRRPVFYGEAGFFEPFVRQRPNTFPEHLLWLRSIADEPEQEPCRRWTIWQYSDTGTVPGIAGPVDLNAFCGSDEDFSRILSARPRPVQPPAARQD
ncbi:glycoside hydrolase family 25 protein [Terrihabitans rhizophilus]|uniref:GH25 family lysozyme n=1 Tax=Terrihabitans rhizophilus TaxID=3092662 RepID=A0ABU4RRJ1_9HYPH|nr:GH25 family lysozyme [Terrihabitans sp. PJ23]MDX6807472.1 GH25 family lysozyme [Terrihabitans sp. PJ23]